MKRLTVRQRKKWLEILLSLELKNVYDVYDHTQTPVLRVQELGQGFLSFLKRIFFGPYGRRGGQCHTGRDDPHAVAVDAVVGDDRVCCPVRPGHDD